MKKTAILLYWALLFSLVTPLKAHSANQIFRASMVPGLLAGYSSNTDGSHPIINGSTLIYTTQVLTSDNSFVSRAFAYDIEQGTTTCLLYTSDAADDTPCVDLGGRRII